MPVTMEGNDVVVIGPRDMATTALVTALDSHGIPARRVDDPAARAGCEQVAVVDVSGSAAVMPSVAAALDAGLALVVLGDDCSSPRVAAAMAGGAAGWVSTHKPVEALVGVLQKVQEGKQIVSADDHRRWVAIDEELQSAAAARTALLDRLTDREFTVLRMLERGLVAAEVAATNVVELTTVRTQIRAILRKLAVNSQYAAIALYRGALEARADRLDVGTPRSR